MPDNIITNVCPIGNRYFPSGIRIAGLLHVGEGVVTLVGAVGRISIAGIGRVISVPAISVTIPSIPIDRPAIRQIARWSGRGRSLEVYLDIRAVGITAARPAVIQFNHCS